MVDIMTDAFGGSEANAAANSALGTNFTNPGKEVINCASGEYCKHIQGLEITSVNRHCSKCNLPIHGTLCGYEDGEMGPLTCFTCVPPIGVVPKRIGVVPEPIGVDVPTSKKDGVCSKKRKTKKKELFVEALMRGLLS